MFVGIDLQTAFYVLHNIHERLRSVRVGWAVHALRVGEKYIQRFGGEA
jgi:hypothetical protein